MTFLEKSAACGGYDTYEPPDGGEWPVCEVCGEEYDFGYYDNYGDFFACENCVDSRRVG